jgi:formyl-CoA transferase
MDANPDKSSAPGPLAGLKVIELGQLIAGPFTGKTLGDMGADIIKVEPPSEGDPLRKWRLLHEGTSVWWEVQSRNKKSVAIDLREPDGRALVRRLVQDADVLIENFRPGAMEKWGLSYEALSADNPGLIMCRISGFGQTGPYRDTPGFGVVGEAMGGLRHLTAEPGRIPVRVGVSIGDTLAALHASIGILSALHERHRNGGRGQVIDVALYEAVFNCMESLLPEYSAFGTVRQAAGSALPGITPSNAYPCTDGYVLVAGNGDSIFRRLMTRIGRQDLAEDPDLARNDGRAKQATRIDTAIGEFTQSRSIADVLAALEEAEVPGGRIYSVADIAADPHFRARGMIQSATTSTGLDVEVPGIVPILSRTPGSIRTGAPRLGQHTDEVLRACGVSDDQLADLRNRGVVA